MLAALLLAASLGVTPPLPTDRVTDQVGVLAPQTVSQLNDRLYRYRQATGHQVLVWLGVLPQSDTPESFSERAFREWKVGKAGHDDGAVIFFFPVARKMRIEVGYGLEGQLTDLKAGRILAQLVAARLRVNDWNGGVTAAVDGVLGAIGGEVKSGPAAEPAPVVNAPPQKPLSLLQIVLFGIIGVVVLIVIVTHPGLAAQLLFSIMASGGGGGGYRGGGSGDDPDRYFRGEGGRSGGGGATGSW